MPAIKVLVVEDEVIVAEDMRSSLEQAGYIVTAVVASGAEALQAATRTRPDIVLMDIVLEGNIDGIETAMRLQEQFRVIILYLTSYDDLPVIQRAKRTEPFGYLLKPFNKRQLVAAIEVACHKYRVEAQRYTSELKLLDAIEAIGDAVLIYDADGYVTLLNPVAETLTGWSRDEAIGRNLTEFFPIVDDAGYMAAMHPAMQAMHDNRVIGLSTRLSLLKRDGTRVPIADSAAPNRHADRRRHGVSGANGAGCRDVGAVSNVRGPQRLDRHAGTAAATHAGRLCRRDHAPVAGARGG